MILFFKKGPTSVTAVEIDHKPTADETERLSWLLGGATPLKPKRMKGYFVGPRREMISPWSTNAVEIARNMGVEGVTRIEQYTRALSANPPHDKMLERVYSCLDATLFDNPVEPEPVRHIDDIHAYNLAEGLALSPEEEEYLTGLARRLGRPLTDSEVFGFSQVNSEHCRHKIFNGTFVIDGREQPLSLFKLIKRTSQQNPGRLVSAYKDNVAFVTGPVVEVFHPADPAQPTYFRVDRRRSVLSLKAETHNFPTTVEPFNGAATGSGGEIRDRLGGGRASLPLAGTAVYMTSYPRNADKLPDHERHVPVRKWLYQTPEDILIKASNGASDFGNKFGQPLICGSVLTFEHKEGDELFAYDKVIMLAGGVGYAMADDALKAEPVEGMPIVVMGGDNYRIGMGGGAVSSVDTGLYGNAIELNAVQRANPEMQKRVANVIRAMAETEGNPVVTIHDHGAGGHLNALSELVEATGGEIDMAALPVGDPTLSAREIIGNESQERMGLIIAPEALETLRAIAERERAPLYVVGRTLGDRRFIFRLPDGSAPIDLALDDMFGSAPKTVITDQTLTRAFAAPQPKLNKLGHYLRSVLALEAVGSKDWLTNKVDRSVTGKVARQQCQGPLQLPLSDYGVAALDYTGASGIATSIGHAPQAALVDAATGSRLAVAEALTNLAGACLDGGLNAVSLSANWMWPCKNPGEDAALYRAVSACSDYVTALGINIPTGKDSLSMTQKYTDTRVMAPGTVIISAAGQTGDARLNVGPVLDPAPATRLVYVPFHKGVFGLAGSALAQVMERVGGELPEPLDPIDFRCTFDALQALVAEGRVLAMHDVSAGGLVTTLLEMCFGREDCGVDVRLDDVAPADVDLFGVLFAEAPAVVLQVSEADAPALLERVPGAVAIGRPTDQHTIAFSYRGHEQNMSLAQLRDAWYSPSFRLDLRQSGKKCAFERRRNYDRQPVRWAFNGRPAASEPVAVRDDAPVAAIIREKGINGEREMAWTLHAAGFRVRDVHMTDLTTGRETLNDVGLIVFCGGFSNSDVAGSAKGWAGAIRYNDTAREAIERFYSRPDTLSLGVCNGCQLMMELNLLNRDGEPYGQMDHNVSHKFESGFVTVTVPESPSVMLKPLEGMELGIWIAHGEGRFRLAADCPEQVHALRYTYHGYPANPNGSDLDLAGLCSADGRHLAMMPHLERTIYPWQCGYWDGRLADTAARQATPWLEAFKAAREWLENRRK